jgi:hypothetical protein
MTLVPNLAARFQQNSATVDRYDVYKTDGDLSTSDGPQNRYVYINGQLRLIAAIWDMKFVGFELRTHPPPK